MNPARFLISEFAAQLRRLSLRMGAAAMLAGLVGASHSALGQTNAAQRALPPALDQRFEAPIGHRQPTVEDVPSNVLHGEGASTENQRDLDKKLDICRGC